jgi:hypothetical protein
MVVLPIADWWGIPHYFKLAGHQGIQPKSQSASLAMAADDEEESAEDNPRDLTLLANCLLSPQILFYPTNPF